MADRADMFRTMFGENLRYVIQCMVRYLGDRRNHTRVPYLIEAGNVILATVQGIIVNHPYIRLALIAGVGLGLLAYYFRRKILNLIRSVRDWIRQLKEEIREMTEEWNDLVETVRRLIDPQDVLMLN